jgi:c(7)-type cytochrome triheme protein
MSKRWFLLVIPLILAVPSVLYAVGMGGMGGMGGMEMGAMVAKVEIHTKTVGTVTFNHNVHGSMFKCNKCHPKLFHKKANSDHVTMKAMEKGKSCGACHNGGKAFTLAGNCVRCHAGDIHFKNEDVGNVTFSHANHLEMFGCSDCHPDLFKAKHGANKMTMAAMEQGQFCGACHDGDTAFSVAEDCESCHQM